MKYHDLHELVQNSQSSRAFFLSLPVKTQCRLHKYNAHIHSAAELHRVVAALQISDRQAALAGWKQD